MKKLKIAQIAPLWYSIPPKKYGGTERIISFLTEELTKRGHKITLFAPKSSETKAELVPLVKDGIISLGASWNDYWWNCFNHSFAFERASDFDVIHCHWEVMGSFFQRFVKTPVLQTFHNIPKSLHLKWPIYKYYEKDANIVFISESEKSNCPVKFKNNWVIYNGIDISQFKFNPHPKDHFVWIARVCADKGTREAIEIAKKAKVKLLLAGQIQTHNIPYFENEVKPELTSRIKYLGEIPQKKVSDFYGFAKGCLYPINWEEPFGLVMAESMAAGTPVIVFDRGSVREVVKDGKTGFIVKNISEAAEAIGKIGQIDRMACRKWVEEKFSLERMVDEYEKLYYEIAERKKIN